MEYLSISEASSKWKISKRRIQILCNEGRLKGATKIGYFWAIPADVEKPDDARVKSGKYIKKREHMQDENGELPQTNDFRIHIMTKLNND